MDDIRMVGVFIPKRLAWRLATVVADMLSLMHPERIEPPVAAEAWLAKEAVLELQKALKRAGYVAPA